MVPNFPVHSEKLAFDGIFARFFRRPTAHFFPPFHLVEALHRRHNFPSPPLPPIMWLRPFSSLSPSKHFLFPGDNGLGFPPCKNWRMQFPPSETRIPSFLCGLVTARPLFDLMNNSSFAGCRQPPPRQVSSFFFASKATRASAFTNISFFFLFYLSFSLSSEKGSPPFEKILLALSPFDAGSQLLPPVGATGWQFFFFLRSDKKFSPPILTVPFFFPRRFFFIENFIGPLRFPVKLFSFASVRFPFFSIGYTGPCYTRGDSRNPLAELRLLLLVIYDAVFPRNLIGEGLFVEAPNFFFPSYFKGSFFPPPRTSPLTMDKYPFHISGFFPFPGGDGSLFFCPQGLV